MASSRPIPVLMSEISMLSLRSMMNMMIKQIKRKYIFENLSFLFVNVTNTKINLERWCHCINHQHEVCVSQTAITPNYCVSNLKGATKLVCPQISKNLTK